MSEQLLSIVVHSYQLTDEGRNTIDKVLFDHYLFADEDLEAEAQSYLDGLINKYGRDLYVEIYRSYRVVKVEAVWLGGMLKGT